MNYIEHFNLLGKEAKQIPCIILHGAPTTATEGAVGMLGMDVDSEGHEIYKCVKVEEGVYTWKQANEYEQYLPCEIIPDEAVGNSTLKEGATATTETRMASGLYGFTQYMTLGAMFGNRGVIYGVYDSGAQFYNSQAPAGTEVEIEIDFRKINSNVIYPTGSVSKHSCTTKVISKGNEKGYSFIFPNPITKTFLSEKLGLTSDEEGFLLGIRTLPKADGTGITIGLSRNADSIFFDINCEKSPNRDDYAYVTYYTLSGALENIDYRSSGVTKVVSSDFLFFTKAIKDYSQMIDATLTKEGRFADAKAVGDNLADVVDKLSNIGNATLMLPEKFDLVVGDTFELFKKGVINCINPDIYDLEFSFVGGGNYGNNYARKYEFTPDEDHVGEKTVIIRLRDNLGNLCDEQSVIFNIIAKPSSIPEPVNILCMGASMVAGGEWAHELHRRLVTTDGTPIGYGLDNISFVGRKTKESDNIATHFEGTGGWTFGYYTMAQKNDDEPNYFWDADLGSEYIVKNNFKKYVETYNPELVNAGITHAVILLGWNNSNAEETTYKADCRKFLDSLLAEETGYPNCKITLLGLNLPSRDGLGRDFGVTLNYWKAVQHVWNLQKWYTEICEEYKSNGYNMEYVNIAGQFDTEYNMPTWQREVNIRNTTKIPFSGNGVHPAESGYMQIADAVLRNICTKL